MKVIHLGPDKQLGMLMQVLMDASIDVMWNCTQGGDVVEGDLSLG